jgi:hypothetical protein
MKNKLIYIFTTLSLLIFNISCNDDKLDILPINILTDDQVFQNRAGIEAYMASLYDKLPLDGFNLIPILSNSTDESMSYLGNAKLTSISDGTWFPWWGYDHIRNVNDLIGKLPNANVSDAEKNSLLGEAKFIRAFYYFGLGKRYGGIPIIKEVQNFTGDNIAELQVPRNTEKEVWDFIAIELDEAASLLPETNISGRATKYAALALKSRAMLYAASVAKYGSVMLNGLVGVDPAEATHYWQSSYDAAKQVIDSGQHSLYMKSPDKEINFTQLFIDTDNPEAIFSVYYQYPDKTHSYDPAVLPFSVRSPGGDGSQVGPTLELVEQFEYLDGTSGTLNLNNPDGSPIFYEHPTDLFKNKDPRCLATVIVPFAKFKDNVIDVQAGIYDQGVKWEAGDYSALYNKTTHQPDNTNGTLHIVGRNGLASSLLESTQTGFYIRKYLDYNLEQARAGRPDHQWIELRYAEVLLNYAEASVELDKISDAKWATNEIRDRAGIKLLDDAEVTLERVRHERLVELAFEGHRWWDYRRWRISDKVLNNSFFTALKPYFDIQANAYRFEKEISGIYPKTFDVKVYYERIDPGEIAKNPNLIQNPNY